MSDEQVERVGEKADELYARADEAAHGIGDQHEKLRKQVVGQWIVMGLLALLSGVAIFLSVTKIGENEDDIARNRAAANTARIKALQISVQAAAAKRQSEAVQLQANRIIRCFLNSRAPRRAARCLNLSLPNPQPGSTGQAGQPGRTGLPGLPGAQGRRGLRGIPGASPDPPAPLPGESGSDGKPGTTGESGATGGQGPTGEPGSKGEAGPAGSQGPAGEAGPAGPAGAQGPQGPQASPQSFTCTQRPLEPTVSDCTPNP